VRASTYRILVVWAVLLLCSWPCLGAPLDIGLGKQLLVDDHVIAHRQNVARGLGEVTKHNGGQPALVRDRPWEDDGVCFYGSVVHDGRKFQMWYCPWAHTTAYAESKDGVHWTKPSLGLFHFTPEKAAKLHFSPPADRKVTYRGKDNNILGHFGDGFTCFIDPHETDPKHRYKAAHSHVNTARACLSYSADGIHWKPYNNGEPVTGRAADTSNQILWDEGAKVYRLFTRQDFGTGGGSGEIRGSRSMANPDVRANPTGWTPVRAWRFDRQGPDEHKRRQIYSLNDWIYEGVHFALMSVYEHPDAPPMKLTGMDYHKRHERDVMTFYIGTSRDGDSWDLTWVYAGKEFVPRGPDGSYDKDMVVPSSNIVTFQDKHWIYYAGYRERHWHAPRKPVILLATLPLDRFVCLEAKGKPGSVTTKPFKLVGNVLLVNVEAPAGWLAVEVLDEAGKPIPGYSRTESVALVGADGIRERPRWKKHPDLSALVGRVVCLRFYLSDARLYAFQLADRPMSDTSTRSTKLRAGAAQVDITPPLGTHLTGAVAQLRPAESVADPLFAKAVVFERNGRKLCLLALDVTIVNQPYTDQIRKAASDRFGLDPNAVMVHATQTHTAPTLGGFIFETFEDLPEDVRWIRGENPKYSALVVERSVEAIARAHDALQPVQIASGSCVEGRFAFNRRAIRQDGRAVMPPRGWLGTPAAERIRYLEGPIDPELGVMAVRAGGGEFATLLLHYTCHPVHVFPKRIISADWPGAWSAALQKRYGPTCVPLVVNGCCGDVNPWDPWDPDYANDHQLMGRTLAETAVGLIDRLKFTDDAVLDWRIRHVPLPIREVEAKPLAAARRFIAEHPQPIWTGDDRTVVDRKWVQAALLVSVDELRRRDGAVDYEIQVLRIGDTAIVGLPGEPFAEGGLRIKMGSPTFPTFIAHCTTQYVGYLPTKRAFAHGGHEVNISSWSKLVPDALDIVVNGAVELLGQVFAEKT